MGKEQELAVTKADGSKERQVQFTAVTKSMLWLIGLYRLDVREAQVLIAMMHEPPTDGGEVGFAGPDSCRPMSSEEIADYAGLPRGYNVECALESLVEKGVFTLERCADESGTAYMGYVLDGEWLDEVTVQHKVWHVYGC